MKSVIGIALLIGLVSGSEAAIVTKAIEYKHGDTLLEGFVAYDDSVKEPRPGVILVHEWWGLTDHMRNMTRQLAEMGYVAFAVDMYGKGIVTDKPDKAGELAGAIRKDPAVFRARAKAGYDACAALPQVDKSRIAAIGFCFGGTTAIEMAYSGLDLRGAVSFHGSLPLPTAEDSGRIKARILVLHGADDPLIPADSIAKFQEALRNANADWQMMYYGGAVHSFTNPGADKVGIEGVKYDARTDRRARAHMKLFFDEVFAK